MPAADGGRAAASGTPESSAAAAALLGAVYAAAGAAAGAWTRLRAARARGTTGAVLFEERLGNWSGHREADAAWVWIHGASVGEAEIAVALARAVADRVAPGLRLVVSATTEAGRARASREDWLEARYFPIDYATFLKRVLKPRPPLLFVAVETEIWPAALAELARLGVPTAVVNARLSERSLPWYRRFGALVGPRVAALDRVLARDEEAAQRWRSIGAAAAAVEVTGNIKFDLALPGQAVGTAPLFEANPRPLVLAASTHDGEEEGVLDAFVELRRRHPDARLLLAPRHPRRASALLGLARSRWLAAVGWSDIVGIAGASRIPDAPIAWPSRVDVVVLDRLGLLRAAYAASRACFVGGSWVEGPGGHNLLESVVAACPASAGPRLGNVGDQVAVLDERGALRIVENATDLSKFWMEAIDSPTVLRERCDAAGRLLELRRGALARSADALVVLLPAEWRS